MKDSRENEDTAAPQAATELFTESFKLSPKQREVLDCLQRFPRGARAFDIAEALAIHVNTARGHLEELLSLDAVRVITAPALGRGRPSLLFISRVPDNRAIAQEYLTLIELMATMLGDGQESSDVQQRATALGAQWAGTIKDDDTHYSSIEEALPPLLLRLRHMGFDPSTPKEHHQSYEILINSCPFILNGHQPPSFICAVHEALIKELMGSDDAIELELKPFNAPGSCSIELRNSTSD